MKTVLITGASRGIGLSLAYKFAESGFDLILNSKNNTPFVYNSEDDCEFDVEQRIIMGNLKLDSVINKLCTEAEKMDLDILINNVGVYLNSSLYEMDYDYLEDVMDINLLATLNLTRGIWPIFVGKKSGLIININSVAGKRGGENEAIYSTTKHGIKGFFESLQYEATRYNIRIVNLFLGAVATDMTRDREDFDKLITPKDVSSFVFRISEMDYPSMRITDIDLGRRIY